MRDSRRSGRVAVDVDDSLGKGVRCFLRQIVPDAALDRSVSVFAGEFLGIGARVRVRRAVGVTLKGNGGYGDDRACGKALLQIVKLRLAFSQPKPPAIVVHDDSHMIRIVEGRRAAIESGVIEGPLWRCEPPDQLCEIV